MMWLAFITLLSAASSVAALDADVAITPKHRKLSLYKIAGFTPKTNVSDHVSSGRSGVVP